MKRPLGILFLVLLCTVVLFCEFDGLSAQTQKRYGGTLRILVDTPPGSPIGIPWELMPISVIPTRPVLEALVKMDLDGNVLPCLAEEWKIAPDKSSMTLRIRRGVKFHDGTTLNAEAVKFNLVAQMEAKRAGTGDWASVEVVDEHTVKINFKTYTNAVFSTLVDALIISPEALQKQGIERLRWYPVGTGPFRIVRIDRDTGAKYEKFQEYWDKGKPYLDGIELFFVKDMQTAKAALLAGQADVLNTNVAELVYELTGKGYVDHFMYSGILCLIPDSANVESPLSKRLVREAISYAIDREAIVKARGFGIWKARNQLATPQTMAYLEDYIGPKYDPQRAKRLLAQAGYPNGFETKLIVQPGTPDRDAVVAIQRFLSEVGIKTELEFPVMGRYQEYQVKGWHGFLVQPWGRFPNYNVFVRFYAYGPERFVSWKRPEGLEKAYNESMSTLMPEKAKVQRLHRILLDDFTVIPVYQVTRNSVATKYVRDAAFMKLATWTHWSPAEAWLAKE